MGIERDHAQPAGPAGSPVPVDWPAPSEAAALDEPAGPDVPIVPPESAESAESAASADSAAPGTAGASAASAEWRALGKPTASGAARFLREPPSHADEAAGGQWRGGPPWATRGGSWSFGRSVFLAVFVLVVELIGANIANFHTRSDARPLDAVGELLIVAAAAALVVRLRWRVGAYVVSLAATVVYVLAGYPYAPVFFAVLVSIFGAIRTGHRVGVWVSTAIGYLIVVLAGRVVPSVGGVELRTPSLATSILAAAWIIVALGVAEAFRVRAERFAEIAATHAEQARARAEQQRRQESEERLRIAQELHDVLGHHLSLINVQAGVGLHLMEEHPGQARAALEAIKEASAAALGEVRSVLGVLRTSEQAAPRAPAPTLANLASLADPTDTVVVGTPVPLPPEVDRAAYRIVQESLTNVRRHAGEGAHATVALTYQPTALVVRVADDGAGAPGWVGARTRSPTAPGASAPTTGAAPRTKAMTGNRPGEWGNGIAGMRARAVALGGSLTAGPGADRGFVVTATLPFRPAS